jgi:Mg-chelatase subunit ChlD
MWGTTWTQSDVDSSNSGFVISAANNAGGSSTTANVDYISMTVYYNYTTSCTVYNRNFNVTQMPTKMDAAKASAKTFIDIMSNSTQAGLVSYSTSATTNRQLANMTASAKTTLKSSIDSLSAGGSTCIGCGIQNGVNELISARSKYPNAVRVEVLLTDGQTNVEPPTTTDASANGRDNHVVIYTIGFGDSVDPTELTNIAMLTGGKYYYAPDAETLTCIFQHIGQTSQC